MRIVDGGANRIRSIPLLSSPLENGFNQAICSDCGQGKGTRLTSLSTEIIKKNKRWGYAHLTRLVAFTDTTPKEAEGGAQTITIGSQSSLPPLPLLFEERLELAAMHCLLAQRQSKGLPKLECVVRE